MQKLFLLLPLLLNNFLISYELSSFDSEYFLSSPKINFINEDTEVSNEEVAQVLLGARHLLKEVDFSILSTIDLILRYDLEDGSELFLINGLLVPECEPYNLQINKKLTSDGIGLIAYYTIKYEKKAYKLDKTSCNESDDLCFFTTDIHSSAESIDSAIFCDYLMEKKPKNTQIALALLSLRKDLAALDISLHPLINSVETYQNKDDEVFAIEGWTRENNQLIDYFTLLITKSYEINSFTPNYTLKLIKND